MRKGTHSCFECRRRKIRCLFPQDNPNVCTECFARGSRCVDQEHVNADVIVDQRKNLRERVSRLEALVDTLLDKRTDKSPAETVKGFNMRTDPFPPTPLSSEASSSVPGPIGAGHGANAPLLSVLEDALNNADSHYAKSEASYPLVPNRDTASNAGGPPAELLRVTCNENHRLADEVDNSGSASELKCKRARQALIDVLPPWQQLEAILAGNSSWWTTWRKKTTGTAGARPLAQYAAYALSEGSPGALGILVLGVGICCETDDVDRYINTVDRWVLSDDEYAATLEGMECLILEAKWYADIGQPRRAWLANRRGLLYAQLMGLHRKRTNSEAAESIWWSLYHGDRFVSLLLGLPYGVSDSHCDLTSPNIDSGPYMSPLNFVNKISIIAGKVIDRNQGVGEQSFALALELDQDMEDLFNKLDPKWVDVSGAMVDCQTNAADLRERLLAQMVFHQIRVYLHLPFMLKSANNPRFSYSRTACLTGSREMLRLYQVLRSGTVEPLYECKAVDFLGFTAAILLLLGLFNMGISKVPVSTPQEQENDWRLIEICIDIFQRASTEKGGKVALQSYEVLEKMRRKLRDYNGCGEDDAECIPSFVIPYFGTISIRRGDKPLSHLQKNGKPTPGSSISSTTQFTPPVDTDSSMLDRIQSQGMASSATIPTIPHATHATTTFNTDPFVAYDGIYMHNNNTGFDTQLNEDGMSNFPPAANNFSWQNVPMDIDQDWSWFLNDGQAQQMPGPGPGQGLGGGLNQGFAQGNFIGL